MPSRLSLSARERQLRSRLRLLLNNSEGFIHGSLISISRRCGKPRCRCASSEKHKHPALFLGQTRDAKTSMLYLPKDLHAQARQAVEDYQEALALLEELNLEARKRLQKAKDRGKAAKQPTRNKSASKKGNTPKRS